MKIHVHILSWNEEKILPFTLDYYSSFCEKIFVQATKTTIKKETKSLTSASKLFKT